MSDALTIRRLPTVGVPLRAPLGEQGGRIMSDAGEIAQIMSGATMQYLAYLELAGDPPQPRGNHYHAHKDERIYILTGRVVLVWQQVQGGTAHGSHRLAAGDLVTIPPYWAHAVQPLGYAQALEFAPTPFDATDRYAYDLTAALKAAIYANHPNT